MPSLEEELFDLIRKYRYLIHEMVSEASDGGDCYLVKQKTLHDLDDLNKESLDLLLKHGKD